MNTKENQTRILIVDDEESIVEVVSNALRSESYTVIATSDPLEARRLIDDETFDVVITDMKMSPIDGSALLRQCKEKDPHCSVIMMTAYASVETAVDAMKQGAYDYVIKPFKLSELRIIIQRALEFRATQRENTQLRSLLNQQCDIRNIIGESTAMKRVFIRIDKIAHSDATVLITGESGTGKEMVARAIFMNSRRAKAPFVTINCGALTETLLESELFGHKKGSFTGAYTDKVGLFQEADSGTLFLDEIGLMSVGLQMKVLRALQEQEIRRVGDTKDLRVDVRVIAATNEDLMQNVKEGTFREDLYYRLNVIPIHLPALRERKEDIPLLVRHFLQEFPHTRERDIHLDRECMNTLMQYNWPGNVRELRNVIERATTLADGDVIESADLPSALSQEGGVGDMRDLRSTVEHMERQHIQRILEEAGGNKRLAAQILNIDLATLYRKIDKLNVQVP